MVKKTAKLKPLIPEIMKYGVSVAILLSGAAAMGGLFLLAEKPDKRDSDALVPTVATAEVLPFSGQLDLEVSGTVVPFREVHIGAEVAGVIRQKYPDCQAGNLVQAGVKLLAIDQQDYRLEIKTLQSEIVEAEQTVAETEEEIRGAIKNLQNAEADLKLQEKEFKRMEELSNSVAIAEMDGAQRALMNSQSQLDLRKNSLALLNKRKNRLLASMERIKNRMERAELNLKRTLIVAPEDGVIVAENVEQGDYVSVGRELLVFESTARVEVLCNLKARELEWIQRFAADEFLQTNRNGTVYGLPQLPVILYDQNDSSIQWSGILSRFDGNRLDATTKSIRCRIVVDQPIGHSDTGRKKALVRGMFVKCKMVVPVNKMHTELVTFPTSAVQPNQSVWVVRDGVLDQFQIDVVDWSPPTPAATDPSVEPTVVADASKAGLKMGDQIIISPLPAPVVGARVNLIDPTVTAIDSRDVNVQSVSNRDEATAAKSDINNANNQSKTHRSSERRNVSGNQKRS